MQIIVKRFTFVPNRKSMNDFINIFDNAAFPIAVCAALFYVVFKQNNDTHKAIENNTKAIIELTALLKATAK